MCRFLETIKIQDGTPHALHFHQDRVNRTLADHYGGKAHFDLAAALADQSFPPGIQRCRVLYDRDSSKIQLVQYLIPSIRSLCALECPNTLAYAYKFADRSCLEQLFESRGPSDDVLLLRNGFLTDTSRMNLALFDGATWWTPELPLLPGTKRAALLQRRIITPRPIHMRDVKNYSKIRLFNALVGWEEALEVSTQLVRFGRINA